MKVRNFRSDSAGLGTLLDRIEHLAGHGKNAADSRSGLAAMYREWADLRSELDQAERLVRQFLARLADMLGELDEVTDASEKVVRSFGAGTGRRSPGAFARHDGRERARAEGRAERERLGELLAVSDELLAVHHRASELFRRKSLGLEAVADDLSGQLRHALSAIAETENELDRLEESLRGAGEAPADGAAAQGGKRVLMAAKAKTLRDQVRWLEGRADVVGGLLATLQRAGPLLRALGERLLAGSGRRVVLRAAVDDMLERDFGEPPPADVGAPQADGVAALASLHARGALVTSETEDRRRRATEEADRLLREFRSVPSAEGGSSSGR